MTGSLRVLLYHRTDDVAAIEQGYHVVSRRLAEVPGMVGNELLGSVHRPGEFVVVSSWRSLADFTEWEHGPDHRRQTSPLRPFRDTTMSRPFGVYHVMGTY
ncbi:antibiotic biosynthesis monooxygenase family protein [Nonomuraea wenchangensis]|uniref:Antibiotic biosynthesis monooxygenase n=1 Tax=Nonomuraea wenchangensis TaxID=568860 RepID=A0A1I0AJP7_9ACTN|nr:antibiotic biosynthesis monooxygenase [Nonomuraea wenchangensis]SES94490.1 Antibiotic biosynthesis monooxygenase [Nonomuraea wenchangensis]